MAESCDMLLDMSREFESDDGLDVGVDDVVDCLSLLLPSPFLDGC